MATKLLIKESDVDVGMVAIRYKLVTKLGDF